MTKLPLAEFALKLISPPNGNAPVSEILVNCHPTGVTLSGAILEAALGDSEHYLVFVTDDVPFEDTLRIYLLSRELEILDSATFAAAYSNGIFDQLENLGESTVCIIFFGTAKYLLRILREPGFAIPLWSDPPGVWRPFTLRRRFTLQVDLRPNREL